MAPASWFARLTERLIVMGFTPIVFSDLAVDKADDLVFGVAPRPVGCGLGLTIGAGAVYPEVNFTLPTMSLTDESWPKSARITRRSCGKSSHARCA